MSAPLRVLLYGATSLGVCEYYRAWMFRPYLEELGVELRPWLAREPPRPAARGVRLAWADRAAIEWADVVVFRRAEQTHHLCFDCSFVTLTRDEALSHTRLTGHEIQHAANEFLRPLWTALEAEPRLLGGRALVYETDDDLLRIPRWNGNRRSLMPEASLIEAMLRRADLVTVSTPVLAERVRLRAPRVRIIRNAIDPNLASGASPEPGLEGEPRVLHYGNLSRIVYYEVCREALEEVKRRRPTLRRVWLGAPDDPAHRLPLERLVDEVRPYVIGVPAFTRALIEAGPDIGLAPLLGDDFDLARSELHWLEYSLAGAVTVASRTSLPGPYRPIRNGVDGFLVRGKREWFETLLRLADSSELRAEVAGRARERVLAEYGARQRAAEWADAFRWAAEHAGIGRLPRSLSVGEAALAAVRRSARASLSYRRWLRRWESAARERLERLRAIQPTLPPNRTGQLVSVIVPVLSPTSPDGLPDRVAAAVESVLAGLHDEVEVIVVGPPSPLRLWVRSAGSRDRIRLLADDSLAPRAVPAHPVDPPMAAAAIEAARARALNRGLAAARGSWIATLDPGVVVTPEHAALLLEVAIDEGLEAVFGWLAEPDGGYRGGWPPDPEDIPSGCELVSASLSFVRFDPRAPLLGTSAVAERWRRLLELGVRVANVETVVARRETTPASILEPTGTLVRRQG